MRVIAGTARSLPLKAPKGMAVRPTTDRIKETLFNMINDRIYDCAFLDLFGGSGGIGIEALSRGAKNAVFVEHDKTAAECIKANLEFTHLSERARVMFTEALHAIDVLYAEGKKFDLIFIDPPYGKLIEKQMLERLSVKNLLEDDGRIIVEALSDTAFDYAGELGFEVVRVKSYGSNKHVFLEAGTGAFSASE